MMDNYQLILWIIANDKKVFLSLIALVVGQAFVDTLAAKIILETASKAIIFVINFTIGYSGGDTSAKVVGDYNKRYSRGFKVQFGLCI